MDARWFLFGLGSLEIIPLTRFVPFHAVPLRAQVKQRVRGQ